MTLLFDEQILMYFRQPSSHFLLLFAAQPPPCALHATCSDTADSFFCTCDDGYEDDGLGGCQDVNECGAVPAPCSTYANCENTDGSFNCTCNPSFAGDGFSCLRDECTSIIMRDCEGTIFANAECFEVDGVSCDALRTQWFDDDVCDPMFNCQQLGCDGGDCADACTEVPAAFLVPCSFCSVVGVIFILPRIPFVPCPKTICCL